MKTKIISDNRYRCSPSFSPSYWIDGVAHLMHGTQGAMKPVGFVCSIYCGFAPNSWDSLCNGFRSKKQLARFCHANGFAIYWHDKKIGQTSLLGLPERMGA